MSSIAAEVSVRRARLAAIGLVFVAPLVAEFLLGNLPLKMIGALVLLAPMYGGGALLIRETARRAGRGWPTIVVLGLAYGILEEAFTTQTLFNPNYLHMNMHLLAPGYIPALGIGAWWTVFVLALHTVWSISTSIALVEAAVPDRAQTPWLGNVGLGITAALFGVGAAGNTLVGYHQDHYLASPLQFASSAAVIVALTVIAFRLPRTRPALGPCAAPPEWLLGALALAAGSAILLIPSRWGWGAAGLILLIEIAVAALALNRSHRAAWGPMHKLALAGGAAMAYAWHSFFEAPVLAGGSSVRMGNAIFTAGAVGLIAFGVYQIRRMKMGLEAG